MADVKSPISRVGFRSTVHLLHKNAANQTVLPGWRRSSCLFCWYSPRVTSFVTIFETFWRISNSLMIRIIFQTKRTRDSAASQPSVNGQPNVFIDWLNPLSIQNARKWKTRILFHSFIAYTNKAERGYRSQSHGYCFFPFADEVFNMYPETIDPHRLVQHLQIHIWSIRETHPPALVSRTCSPDNRFHVFRPLWFSRNFLSRTLLHNLMTEKILVSFILMIAKTKSASTA